MSVALEMIGINKTYPGVNALVEASLTVNDGEIHALLGENGAGKSTLMKILAGAVEMDRGEIRLYGKATEVHSPLDAIRDGIAMIYQEFNLVPTLSAAENVFLGREPRAAVPGFVDFHEMETRSQGLMDQLGVKVPVKAPCESLSVAQQQMVEIAKAVSQDAKIIIMDEPSATLSDHELSGLFDMMRTLKAQGVSIVYISHRLEEVFTICDRATVLRDGKVIETRPVSEWTRADIIQAMVGRELVEQFPHEEREFHEPALQVEGLSRAGMLHDITLEVRKGEIVGLAGLVGAGRTELARAIFGADPVDKGFIRIEGKVVHPRSPAEAIRYGIGMLTEDRKSLGLVLGMAVRENQTMANLGAVCRAGFIDGPKERAAATGLCEQLRVATPSIEQTVANLSGGNQQKVVLAKWLFTQSKVLIFDEPTRGIDVGAKFEIYQLMNRLAAQGVAILMISSELPEVIGMSDRILVMHEGRIAGEVSRTHATQEAIMHLAIGE